MDIQPLIEGQYFHLYNRGVNGENLFKERENYFHFLEKYKLYCSGIFNTLAYCLLKNHFHLVVYLNENVKVPRTDGKEGLFRLNASKQLGHCFNAYAQSINKMYKRTGPLFESPFERKWIEDEHYLRSVICYCNGNAVHHGFVNNISDWEFSSYHAVLNNDTTIISVDEVISRFGNITTFKEANNTTLAQEEIEKYSIERSL